MTAVDDAAGRAGGFDDAPRPLGWRTVALIGVVLAPLLVGAVHAFVDLGGYHAVSDNALNEMVVRSLSRHLQLVGPYARDDWSHPGPVFYFLMWPMYHVFGANSAAMAVGALVVNGVAFAGIVTIGRRWGGWELAIPLALVVALVTVHLPHEYLSDPWNPSLTVVPFGAFLLLAWAATCGDRWALPAAAFVASFCAQTHVGYVTLAVPVLAWAVLWCWFRSRRRDDAVARFWVPFGWTVLVLAVVWALPVYQQITGTPGNIERIVNYFRTTPEPAHTLLDGWRLLAAQFKVNADWITGAPTVTTIEPNAIGENPIPILLVAFVVAGAVAWRRWRPLRELAIVLLLAMVVGIVGMSQTIGPIYDYRLRWIWIVAGIATAYTVAVGYRSVAALHTHRAQRALVAIAAAALVAIVAIGVNHLADADPYPADAARTDAVARGIIDHVRDGRGTVILRATSYGGYLAVAGLILRLDDAGIPAQVDRDTVQSRLTFGPDRVHHHEPVREIVVLADGDAIAALRKIPGARQIAFGSGALGRSRGDRTAAQIHADDLAAFAVPPSSVVGT